MFHVLDTTLLKLKLSYLTLHLSNSVFVQLKVHVHGWQPSVTREVHAFVAAAAALQCGLAAALAMHACIAARCYWCGACCAHAKDLRASPVVFPKPSPTGFGARRTKKTFSAASSKAVFYPARPDMLSGAPSPSPTHRGRSGHAGHNKSEARCGGTDASTAHSSLDLTILYLATEGIGAQ
jgi:hypothetical protein